MTHVLKGKAYSNNPEFSTLGQGIFQRTLFSEIAMTAL